MALQTMSGFQPDADYGASARPRAWRRLKARYRLWRMAARHEIRLAALDRKQRLDIGRPIQPRYRWLEELMRGSQRPWS
ncbi:hypothetical protein [Devosia salina]|uniref:DUF1127 domain-containing protein n=1 Tax=Devosia salina TaxID=2860336 RepID=A0ABX8WHV2_9HYPH|nr:hypothetical protein [Devosia salina]QYO77596.1 hypothetical protein K1X15_03205 [Devosia salina]